ncbi:MAG: ATP-binding protein [Pseudomonadota bacterium]
MDVSRELGPRSEMLAVVVLLVLAPAAVVVSVGSDFPALHSILDTAALILTALLAFLLWDLGWRTGQSLARLNAVCFAVVALLDLLHVVTALDFSEAHPFAVLLRPGSFSPALYLLPAGLLLALPLSRRDASVPLFAAALLIVAAGLMALFAWVPRYSPPGILGITRPTLILAPLLWIPVIVAHWGRRDRDRLGEVLVVFAVLSLCVPLIMLFSHTPADKVAVIGHFVRVAGEVFLLFSLMQMGTFDTAQRMRAERDLSALNEALESRVRERTLAIESANSSLREEMATRELAERKTLTQLERLSLLHQIAHAVGERQDPASIFQVVLSSLEDHMPVDFACLCNYDSATETISVAAIGSHSAALAAELGLTKDALVVVDRHCMKSVLLGELVHEPDLPALDYSFPRLLASRGLLTLVAAPLVVEARSAVTGLLLVARKRLRSFTSSDCEFLNQLSAHVALAANQAQLHEALQRAYEELRDTQQAVMQQERLRALGQMASGIAHDINNAISPVVLYVDAILTHETGFSERARRQLEIIQRATGDVAHTVARMGEFYRQRETRLELTEVHLNEVLEQVFDLTRARWSDMAQQRGAVIETKIENGGENPLVMGIESELREALVNLVLNATDAMPEGGTLTLRTGYRLESGRGIARRAFIEVVDTGIGMDEATRRRCLEPFFTTKGERGSGMGLAMVYGITQRHGVEIDIVSAPGTGTIFRLIFPLSSLASPAATGTRIRKIPNRTRILLIDDDPLLLSSLRDTLTDDGHQVHTANGGKAGIDAFMDALNSGTPFPAVITDLGMPHVDGRAVAAAIKSAAPATAIIMLTGWGQRLVATGDIPEQVSAVLSKPPKMVELRQCLAECLGD